MIEPPPPGEPYPGRLPPLPQQWARLGLGVRLALVVFPVALIALLLAVAPLFGVFVAVLLVGSAGATMLYHKNRTDRHNAAVARGEIQVVDDPHLRPASGRQLGAEIEARLAALGFEPARLGRVMRFDGGWLVSRRSRTELAVVLGDDGGHALFDPRSVSDLRAASEYLAGRGRDPG